MAILPHLIKQGHDVRVVGYDRSYRDLKDRFDVFETEGLTIGQEDNEVSIVKTITENLARVPRGHARSKELKQELFKEFRPDAVITDFEPMTAYLANYFEIPLITLDNQHRMRYMDLDIPDRLIPGMALTKTIIRAMIPKPDVSLVTTFHFGTVTNDRTFLFPPLIRPPVLAASSSEGDHIVVYFTKGAGSFVSRLKEYPLEQFFVYGQGKEGTEGNVTFRPFSREGFVSDLASTKAVMASAGFTLITEALHLKKPYLALPTKTQFEQELNALMLDRMGCGKGAFRVTGETIGDFLYRLLEYKEKLEEYQPSDGSEIREKLDILLADGGKLAREYMRDRK